MNIPQVSAEQWQRVGVLFDQLSTLPPPERDFDTLQEPPEVRELLRRMLVAHDTADAELLDRTLQGVAGALLDMPAASVPPADYAGRGFGPWRAIEEIGRGGMAVVLRGERADGQFEKEVAIKLLPRAGSEAEKERLLAEMRILARLEHANIARLIDGGIDADGTPYLVMEYVHGVPITDYCREHQLEPRACADLFGQVVEAVRFAHRHLVVHCDIKPANVLVTEDGQAKLVDFGIAGLMAPGAESATRGLMCSPAYAAPEQMRDEPPATSQDIFSLSAVLYELLCGHRARDLATATRLLFKPDTATATTIAPPSTHNRDIDADLDAICLQGMAGEPEQRYPTASALLADLRRWRDHEPVSARNGGTPYRAGKWLRRHWAGAAMAMLAVFALLAGTGAALWQANRATLEAQRAQQEAERATTIKDFLLSLLRAGDPLRVGGPVLDTREVMRLGAERIRANQTLGLPVRLEILNTIADVQRTLNENEDAREFLEKALDLARSKREPPRLQHAETLLQLGLLESGQSNFEESTDWFEQALAAIEGDRSPAADHLRARTLIQLAGMKARFGRVPDAETDLDRAESLIERMDPPDLELAMLLANTRGVAAYHVARYEPAYEYLKTTAELHRQMGNEDQAPMVQTLSSLAAIATMLGRLDEALEFDREAVAIARKTYPEGHRQIGNALFALGDTLRQLGRFDEAEQVLAEGREIQVAGENLAEVQLIDRTRLRVLVSRGDYADALELATRVRPAMEERWGARSRQVVLVLEQELAAATHLGDSAHVEQLIALSADRLSALAEADRWVPLAQVLRWRLGHTAWLEGDLERAEHWLQESDQAPDDSAHHPTPMLLLAGLQLRLSVARGVPVPTEYIDLALVQLDSPEASKATASAIAYAWCSLLMAYQHDGDPEGVQRARGELRELEIHDQRLSEEARTEIRTLLAYSGA